MKSLKSFNEFWTIDPTSAEQFASAIAGDWEHTPFSAPSCAELAINNTLPHANIPQLKLRYDPNGGYETTSMPGCKSHHTLEVYFSESLMEKIRNEFEKENIDFYEWIEYKFSNKTFGYPISPFHSSSETEDRPLQHGISFPTDFFDASKFKSFFNFLSKTDPKSFDENAIETLKEFLHFREISEEETLLVASFKETLQDFSTSDDPSISLDKLLNLAEQISDLQKTNEIYFELSKALICMGGLEQAEGVRHRGHAGRGPCYYHGRGCRDVPRHSGSECQP